MSGAQVLAFAGLTAGVLNILAFGIAVFFSRAGMVIGVVAATVMFAGNIAAILVERRRVRSEPSP